MKKKSTNKNLTSFSDHLDKEYGKRGTKKREKFEEGFDAFKLGVMTIKELNKSKTPIVKINKTLDKLSRKVLFPEKLEEANHILKTVGLPKTKISRKS